MPWHQKAMKDVVTCDKPRKDGNGLRPGDLLMGQPVPGNAGTLHTESIGMQGQRGELKHLSTPRKRKQ